MSTDTSPGGDNGSDTGGTTGSNTLQVQVDGSGNAMDRDFVDELFSELETRTRKDREEKGVDENLYTSSLPDDGGDDGSEDGSAAAAKEQTKAKPINPDDLFRHEAAISQMELRLEVAERVEHYVLGDERTVLDEKLVHAWGDLSFVCGSRSRSIEGDYTRTTDRAELFMMVHHAFNEEVHGGVAIDMTKESQVIMGGGYIGTVMGPFMRICGWSDFLCWGGWVEADGIRTEIGNAMLRSMMNFVHTAGVRALAAYNFFDDFTTRIENIGSHNSNETTIMHSGSPGSGVTSDM